MARRPTPTMPSRRVRKLYLERDLYNDLRWLLCAATDWHIQNAINHYLDPRGEGIRAYHAQVYMLDSAALHARSLFEFLTIPATGNHFGANTYLGGNNVVPSARYGDWADALHHYLMHMQPRPGIRPKLRTRASARKKLHLNEMPVEFGEEIIDLWHKFVKELRNNRDSLANVAANQLDKAIADARRVRDNAITAYILTTRLPHGFSIPAVSWEEE